MRKSAIGGGRVFRRRRNGQKMVTDGMKIETVAERNDSPSFSDALREALKKMFDERDTSHHGEGSSIKKPLSSLTGHI